MDSKRLMELITYWQKKGRPEIVASLQRELDRALAAEAPKSEYTQGAVPKMSQPWREPPEEEDSYQYNFPTRSNRGFEDTKYYGEPTIDVSEVNYPTRTNRGYEDTPYYGEAVETPVSGSVNIGLGVGEAATPSPTQREIYAPTPNKWQAAQRNFYGNTTDVGSLVGGMFSNTDNVQDELMLPQTMMTPDEVEANKLNSWSWSYAERDRKKKAREALKKKNPNLKY